MVKDGNHLDFPKLFRLPPCTRSTFETKVLYSQKAGRLEEVNRTLTSIWGVGNMSCNDHDDDSQLDLIPTLIVGAFAGTTWLYVIIHSAGCRFKVVVSSERLLCGKQEAYGDHSRGYCSRPGVGDHFPVEKVSVRNCSTHPSDETTYSAPVHARCRSHHHHKCGGSKDNDGLDDGHDATRRRIAAVFWTRWGY